MYNYGEVRRSEKKTRGSNKCQEIAKLKAGDKLPIIFYNNCAVGENHSIFSRHLGIIVRDTNICPIKVRKWKDIGEREKEHMWRAVTDIFSNENMETYRQHVLDHMYVLWIKRRADLLRHNVTKKNITLKQARKIVPRGLTRDEWEWLIDEVYSTEDYKQKSMQNSDNRKQYKKELLHRTGSKPYRQVAWNLGAKDGKQPSILEMFRETHKKGKDLANPDVSKKYDEIRDTIKKNPSFSHAEVVEEVFKSKSRQHVVGYGGGVKLKDVKGSCLSKTELETQLNNAKKENQVLSTRLATMEAKNQNLTDRICSAENEIKAMKDLILHYIKVLHLHRVLPKTHEVFERLQGLVGAKHDLFGGFSWIALHHGGVIMCCCF